MKTNLGISKSKDKKDDEFYTLYCDIEKELINYKDQLKNKIIYCNCDSENSNFWKYLRNNFEYFQLKKLICTHLSINEDDNYILIMNSKDDIQKMKTKNNVSFDNVNNVKILDICDIVITNPPFSIFRKYFDLLIKSEKDFIIIGSNLACCYFNVFPYFIINKIRLGTNTIIKFLNKDNILKSANGQWITTFDNNRPKIDLTGDFLKLKYDPEFHIEYDNYNAINVDKTINIPNDYYGVIGVPISYLQKHNNEQFELIGIGGSNYVNHLIKKDCKIEVTLNGKETFKRIFIKRIV